MSGGSSVTPRGGSPVTPRGGFIRQRHSQGYTSGWDDLEDDASSKLAPLLTSMSKSRTWIEILENVLWIASAVLIIYYGDWHSNLIYLLWHDNRIRRAPLYLGSMGVGLNVVIFFYISILAWGVRKFDEKWESSIISVLPIVTLIGLVSFCLFSFALWPIWSFLTLPLLFSLYMAGMVIFPCIIFGTFRPQTDVLRVD